MAFQVSCCCSKRALSPAGLQYAPPLHRLVLERRRRRRRQQWQQRQRQPSPPPQHLVSTHGQHAHPAAAPLTGDHGVLQGVRNSANQVQAAVGHIINHIHPAGEVCNWGPVTHTLPACCGRCSRWCKAVRPAALPHILPIAQQTSRLGPHLPKPVVVNRPSGLSMASRSPKSMTRGTRGVEAAA